MTIAIRTVATGTDAGGSASVSATTDSSPQTGDVVIAINSNDFYALSNMGTPSGGPGSWNLYSGATADGGSNLGHIQVWWAVLSASGAFTVTVTETGSHDEDKGLALWVLSGVDTTTPIEAGVGTSGANSASQPAPSVTAISSAALMISTVVSAGGAATASYTAPGSMTAQYELHTGTMSAAAAREQLAASGATGARTFTAANSIPWSASSIALKPAASGGATQVGQAARPFHPGKGPTPARFYKTPRPTGVQLASVTLQDAYPDGIRVGTTADTLAIDVQLLDVAGGLRVGTTADTLAVGVVLPDSTVGGIRAGDTFGEAAVNGLELADPTVGSVRLGSTPDALAIGLSLADSAGAVRAGATVDTLAVGVATLDPAVGGVRLGSTVDVLAVGTVLADPSVGGIRAGDLFGETATTALVVNDPSVGSIRLGSTVGSTAIGLLLTDTPGGLRLSNPSDTLAATVVLTDTPGSVRAGNTFGETAANTLTISDPSSGAIRMGSVFGEILARGVVLTDTASGVRAGSTVGTVAIGLSLADTAGGIRLGSTTDTLSGVQVTGRDATFTATLVPSRWSGGITESWDGRAAT